MPPFTKNAIVASFLKLASRMPMDKMTVRDIVDDCGVNRNTFYYYFRDIYAVAEDQIRELLSSREDWKDGIACLAAFCTEHRRAVRNVYEAVGRDTVERYLREVIDRPVMAETAALLPDADQETLKHAAALYRHMTFGILNEWYQEGMQENFSFPQACAWYRDCLKSFRQNQ